MGNFSLREIGCFFCKKNILGLDSRNCYFLETHLVRNLHKKKYFNPRQWTESGLVCNYTKHHSGTGGTTDWQKQET